MENSGEEILDDQLLVSFDNVLECLSQSRGSLFLTAVQLVFYNAQDTLNDSPSVQLKYFAISNYSVVDGTTSNLKKICIFAKNFQSFEFELPQPQIEKICSTIFEKTKNLFTQNYAIKNSLYFSEFSYYNWKFEFERQKISKEWKITEINSSYSICPSYMNTFIVPSNITDEEIKEVSLYRSKGRIPVLTYYHSKNGSSISRSSQPMVGLFRTRNKFDEKYLDQIRLTQRDPKKQKLFIVDCRSALNAYANSAKGAGTELIQNYPDCSLEYCGIENIHAMRNSLYEIFNYISPANSSAWTSQLLSIIQSSKRVAEIIDAGYPVLIHCSDGWDRTSQISSLSQLLIDPFYRTIEGFQQLIEKDWVRFGHKFLDRCAHGKQNYWEEHEQSPIFLQFLDCVYQLSRQYHTIFEFNSNLLVFILDSVYSCDFGEFLFNNEKQRKQFKAKIASVWKYFEKNRSQYVNKFYEKYEGVVLPNCSIKLLQLWDVYVKRSGGKRIENQEYYFNLKLNEEELKQIELQKQLEDLNSKYEKLLQEIALNKQNLTNEAILKTSPEDEKGKYYALLQSGYFSGKDFNIPSIKKFSPEIIEDYDPAGNAPVIDLRGLNNNIKQIKNEKNENDLTGSVNIIDLGNHDENFDLSGSQSAQSWAEYLIGSACKLTTSIWSTKELIENTNDPTPAV